MDALLEDNLFEIMRLLNKLDRIVFAMTHAAALAAWRRCEQDRFTPMQCSLYSFGTRAQLYHFKPEHLSLFFVRVAGNMRAWCDHDVDVFSWIISTLPNDWGPHKYKYHWRTRNPKSQFIGGFASACLAIGNDELFLSMLACLSESDRRALRGYSQEIGKSKFFVVADTAQ